MAFPSVIGTPTERLEGLNVTTHNWTADAGNVSGELLLGFFAVDATETISNMTAGWTNIVNVANAGGGTGHVWYRIADETEVSDTYDTGSAETSVNRVYRITNWHGTTPPEAVDDGGYTSTANPDPPSITPSWGAEDTLFIAWLCHDGAATASGYPANYTGNNYTVSSGGSAVGWALATRELNATVDDPGTFTMTGADTGVAVTIAVRPAAVGGGIVLPERSWPRGASRGVVRGAA